MILDEYKKTVQRWHADPFPPSGDTKIDRFLRKIGDGTAIAMQCELNGNTKEALAAMRALTPIVDEYSQLADRPDTFATHLRIIERLEALCH